MPEGDMNRGHTATVADFRKSCLKVRKLQQEIVRRAD